VREVAQERVRQLERIGERLLRERIIGTDPENLHVQSLEIAVVGLPGREIRRSNGGKIGAVKLKEHEFLSPELAQADFSPGRAGECEIGRFVTHLDRPGKPGHDQPTGQKPADKQRAYSVSAQHMSFPLSFIYRLPWI
jgi:hypothetical protein